MRLLKILFHPTMLWEDTGPLRRTSGYTVIKANSYGVFHARATFQGPYKNYDFTGTGTSRHKAVEDCRKKARECESGYDMYS